MRLDSNNLRKRANTSDSNTDNERTIPYESASDEK